MSSVALDSTALIYAMERVARRESERDDCERVHDYIEWLRIAQRSEIQIPAPAFAEFLAFYGNADQAEQVAAVTRRGFVITPLDLQASVRSAQVWIQIGGKSFRKRMHEEFDISKQCVKVDYQIVGTALAHGAESIITVDTGVIEAARLASLRVIAPADCVVNQSRPIPQRPRTAERSQNLFDTIYLDPPEPGNPPLG